MQCFNMHMGPGNYVTVGAQNLRNPRYLLILLIYMLMLKLPDHEFLTAVILSLCLEYDSS
jgi:hypothetical protein